MRENIRQFIGFTQELISNKCSYELWQKFAVRPYSNSDLESAREALVNICIEDSGFGDITCDLEDTTIQQINRVVDDLEADPK